MKVIKKNRLFLTYSGTYQKNPKKIIKHKISVQIMTIMTVCVPSLFQTISGCHQKNLKNNHLT
jgi:hypothetical protein